eukprot:2895624-Pyramimonas_sp.AAC.1
MRPLGPPVELPNGHEACGLCAELCAADACERGHWGLRWSSLRATSHVRGVQNCVPRTHANAGAVGEAP